MKTQPFPSLLDALSGLADMAITSVVFIEDYFQIEFGEARLSILANVRFWQNGRWLDAGEVGFRTALEGCVGSIVEQVREEGDNLIFRLSPTASLLIRLAEGPEESVVPEQLIYTDGIGRTWVT